MLRFPTFPEPGARAIAHFRETGYLVVPDVLSRARTERLKARFPKLFRGEFDTGIYPDEWHWREGLSLPDVTRHISNAWKADLAVARLALSPDLARIAALLAGWSGARLGQDTLWWKPPGAKPVAYHQDSSFMDFLAPPETITCWIALDDTERDAGTLEYAPGSHLWPLTALPKAFHAAEDYRGQMEAAARAAGRAPPAPAPIEVRAGSMVFHDGAVWHGSGPNRSAGRTRRSIGLHFLSEGARFSDRPGGYIYRRYQRTGEAALDESFFPLLFSGSGARTPWLEHYCRTGRRVAPRARRAGDGVAARAAG